MSLLLLLLTKIILFLFFLEKDFTNVSANKGVLGKSIKDGERNGTKHSIVEKSYGFKSITAESSSKSIVGFVSIAGESGSRSIAEKIIGISIDGKSGSKASGSKKKAGKSIGASLNEKSYVSKIIAGGSGSKSIAGRSKSASKSFVAKSYKKVLGKSTQKSKILSLGKSEKLKTYVIIVPEKSCSKFKSQIKSTSKESNATCATASSDETGNINGRSQFKEMDRDSWIYRNIIEYEKKEHCHGEPFVPFLFEERSVISYNQQEMDKLIDIDSHIFASKYASDSSEIPRALSFVLSKDGAVGGSVGYGPLRYGSDINRPVSEEKKEKNENKKEHSSDGTSGLSSITGKTSIKIIKNNNLWTCGMGSKSGITGKNTAGSKRIGGKSTGGTSGASIGGKSIGGTSGASIGGKSTGGTSGASIGGKSTGGTSGTSIRGKSIS